MEYGVEYQKIRPENVWERLTHKWAWSKDLLLLLSSQVLKYYVTSKTLQVFITIEIKIRLTEEEVCLQIFSLLCKNSNLITEFLARHQATPTVSLPPVF